MGNEMCKGATCKAPEVVSTADTVNNYANYQDNIPMEDKVDLVLGNVSVIRNPIDNREQLLKQIITRDSKDSDLLETRA